MSGESQKIVGLLTGISGLFCHAWAYLLLLARHLVAAKGRTTLGSASSEETALWVASFILMIAGLSLYSRSKGLTLLVGLWALLGGFGFALATAYVAFVPYKVKK